MILVPNSLEEQESSLTLDRELGWWYKNGRIFATLTAPIGHFDPNKV